MGKAAFAPRAEGTVAGGTQATDKESPIGSKDELGGPVQLGDYLLEEEIAHGGMGVIYRARQLRLDRVVALKLLLLGRYSSSESIKRFYREAQSAAALRHPNIVSIYEVGEADGQPFLAMEYVDGRSLAQVLRQGPISQIRAAEYARSVADAIHYAHQRGVLHRDIKPSNVLLDAFDQVRLTDFGLAKKMDGSSDITLTGELMGSPNYLSPEQASARNEKVGPGSDVYGVGALLYELLTGRPPFMAQSIQDTLLHIRDNDPVPPARLNPAVPVELDTITLKCLEKEPDRRYRTAQELGEDLGRFLRHEPILARPASLLERTVKWVRRHRTRAALIATVAVSLVTMTAGSLWFSFRVERAHNETEAAKRRLERNLFVREWNDAEQLLEEGKSSAALIWFARVLREDPSNHVAASRLLSLLADTTFSIPSGPPLVHTSAVNTASFSSDGQHMVTAADDGRVRIWNKDTALPTLELPRRFTAPAATFLPGSDEILVAHGESVSRWSPDGVLRGEQDAVRKGVLRWAMSRDGRRAALVASSDEPSLWDPSGPRQVTRLLFGDPRSRAAPISADGQFVLRSYETPAQDGWHVGIWDIDSGRQVWGVRLPGQHPSHAMYSGTFSDDNRYVAVSRWAGQTLVWPVRMRDEGEPGESGTGPPILNVQLGEFSRVESLQFFDGNRRLIIANGDGVVRVCDLQTGQLSSERIEHAGGINTASISPDAETLATASVDGTVRFWDLRPRKLNPVVATESNEVWDAQFSPDASWFVMGGDPDAQIRDTQTGAVRHRLPMGRLISRVGISPDGRRIVTTTEQGELRIWDAQTGAPLIPAVRFTESLHDLAFSEDGRWICIGAPAEQVWLLNTTNAEPVFPPFVANASVVRSLVSSRHGRLIAGTTLGDVHFWSLSDRRPLPAASRHRGVVWSAHFSRDERLLATASGDQTILVWDVRTAKVLREFRAEKAVYKAVFSPDGHRLLGGSADRTARIWDLNSGRQVSEVMRHPGGVWYTEYSPDGRFVVTGDDEGYARLWDAESGLPVGNWLRSGSTLKQVRFSPDGRLVITTSRDHTARVWPVTSPPSPAPRWLPLMAESIAGRRLAADGGLELVSFESWRSLRAELLANSNAAPDFYSQWARWFLRDRLRPSEAKSE